MTLTDIIILISVILIISFVIYFSLIKNKNNGCKSCSLNGKNNFVKEYYRSKCRHK